MQAQTTIVPQQPPIVDMSTNYFECAANLGFESPLQEGSCRADAQIDRE
jgi:hypothetical protein